MTKSISQDRAEFGHVRQQAAGQAAGPLSGAHAQVRDAKCPQDRAADPDYPQFHAHLGGQRTAPRHEIAEMGRQLEVGPAGKSGEGRLQQCLQLLPEIPADLVFRNAQKRGRRAAAWLLAHAVDSTDP